MEKFAIRCLQKAILFHFILFYFILLYIILFLNISMQFLLFF